MKETFAPILATWLALTACSPSNAPPLPPDAPFGPPRVRILVNERPHDEASHEQELDEVRYGDPLHVVVDGIEPTTIVTVEAKSGAGTSRARFRATEDGSVDLSRDAPLEGDWQGADGEAFLWSMTNPPGGPLDLTVSVRVLGDNDEELASDVVSRRFIDDGIVVETIAQDRSQGTLALPAGDGTFAAVLVFGGSEGGTTTGAFHAMYLASLGYAALGVGYFGAPGLPATLTEVPLEIIEEDLALLTADPRIDPERVVVMGGSRGGELALLAAARFPTVVKGVVAQVPSGLVWSSTTSFDVSAWTVDGEPLPFMPSTDTLADVRVDQEGSEHWTTRPTFLADLEAASATALDAATIRSEDIAGPVLYLAADDDAVWPSCLLANIAHERRQAAGLADDDVFLCSPQAGHASVGPPGWSTVDSVEAYRADLDVYLVLGGTPQGNGRARRAGDTALRAFLERIASR